MKYGRGSTKLIRGQNLSKEQNIYLDNLLSLKSSYYYVKNERDEVEVIPKLFDIAEKVGCSTDAVQYRTNSKLRMRYQKNCLDNYLWCAHGLRAFGDLMNLTLKE